MELIQLLMKPQRPCYQFVGFHKKTALNIGKDQIEHSQLVTNSRLSAGFDKLGMTRKREQKTIKQQTNPATGYFTL